MHGSTPHISRLPRSLAALALSGASILGLGCAATTRTVDSGNDPRSPRVDDAMRAAEIRMALLEQLGDDALGIAAEVDGRRATLRGEVEERSTEELAEEIALSVAGISKVNNRLRLPAASREEAGGRLEQAARHTESEVSDAALEARVGLKLLGEIGRHALDLEVEASDGVVSLRGTLPDEERKKLALAAARGTSGVREVLDLLRTRS